MKLLLERGAWAPEDRKPEVLRLAEARARGSFLGDDSDGGPPGKTNKAGALLPMAKKKYIYIYICICMYIYISNNMLL